MKKFFLTSLIISILMASFNIYSCDNEGVDSAGFVVPASGTVELPTGTQGVRR